MKEKILKYAKEHFIGFVFSAVFGATATVSLFFFTSSPSSSSEIKSKLANILVDRLGKELRIEYGDIQFNSIISQSLDLSTNNSVFVYSTAVSGEDIYRILAVFEPQRQNILDKLVGRPGFYRLASSSWIHVPYTNNLLPENIKIEDYDLDGNKEIVIRIKSVWADSTSSGLIVLKKNDDEIWRFLSLPSLSTGLSDFLSGKLPHPEGLSPVSSPIIWFGQLESPDVNFDEIRKSYANYSIYEDDWKVTHNGISQKFITLRNGGVIEQTRHPFANHLQFGVVANVSDGNAVLGIHNLFITYFKLGNRELERDILWNWGFPMLTIAPQELSGIDLNEFHQVGISTHLINGTFFGYTEFQRVQ